MKPTTKPTNTQPYTSVQERDQPNKTKFYKDYGEMDIPFDHKREASKYAGMTKEEKMKETMKRIQDDKARANQQLTILKKEQTKKKTFVTKKKVYDLSSGYAICVQRIPDKEAYYFGLSNGSVLYFDINTEKINTTVKVDSPIIDIVALSNDKMITIDDFSTIRIYQEYKLVKKAEGMSHFLSGSQHFSKVFAANEAYLFFINAESTSVVRMNLEDYSCDEMNLGHSKIFQIALYDEKLFGISEDGYLCLCTMNDMVENPPDPDEEEAYPQGNSITQVKIENLTNEQLGIELKLHERDMLENSMIVDGESVLLNNSTNGQDSIHVEAGEKPMKASDISYQRMHKVLTTQVINSFFRTIAVSQDYVAVVAHDGKGHNIIYVYTHKLQLKAFKYLHIEENDYSFNLNKYIHKLEIMQKKEGTFIIAVTHKKEYKIFVYKLENDQLNLYKRFKNVHSNLITDMKQGDDLIITASKDKKVNFYSLDFKYNIK